MVANEWATCLEDEAARAKTPEQRAAYDPHRLGVYLELGEPERAIPMLQASEHDLPNDYNPPVQLATLYREMGRYGDALRACDRAMSRATGVAKLRVYMAKGRVLDKKGDKEAANKTYAEAIDFGHTLPESAAKPYLSGLQKLLDTANKPH